MKIKILIIFFFLVMNIAHSGIFCTSASCNIKISPYYFNNRIVKNVKFDIPYYKRTEDSKTPSSAQIKDEIIENFIKSNSGNVLNHKMSNCDGSFQYLKILRTKNNLQNKIYGIFNMSCTKEEFLKKPSITIKKEFCHQILTCRNKISSKEDRLEYDKEISLICEIPLSITSDKKINDSNRNLPKPKEILDPSTHNSGISR